MLTRREFGGFYNSHSYQDNVNFDTGLSTQIYELVLDVENPVNNHRYPSSL